MLGAPMDIEDVIEKIRDGLGDKFHELASSIQVCETPISFEELHEKLLTFEAIHHDKTSKPQLLPTTANVTHKTLGSRPSFESSYSMSHRSPMSYGTRPIL